MLKLGKLKKASQEEQGGAKKHKGLEESDTHDYLPVRTREKKINQRPSKGGGGIGWGKKGWGGLSTQEDHGGFSLRKNPRWGYQKGGCRRKWKNRHPLINTGK